MRFNRQGEKGYRDRIVAMLAQYRAWIAAHPDQPVLISFRVPRRAFVIAALPDAIQQGYVVVDANGKQMFEELGWLIDDESVPTLAQTQAVMEYIQKGKI